MKSSIRNDKNISNQIQDQDQEENQQKERRIKRLTQINKELIEALKLQNEELTKKISKQKVKWSRSNTVKSVPSKTKQMQSIKKQLSNAYKQIDMYKNTIQSMKTKQAPIQQIDKIKDYQNKIKNEDQVIQNLHKQLKYIQVLRQKQQKDLTIIQSQEVKQNKIDLEKQITQAKQKIKLIKKNSLKRNQVQKKQHTYFLELQKAYRKLNDQYYPGKVQSKKQLPEDKDINDQQWKSAQQRLAQLKLMYQEHNKKMQNVNRQKIKQIKSTEENQLKLKQKLRKLAALRNRVNQLAKLTVTKQQKQIKLQPIQPLPKKQQSPQKNKPLNNTSARKWNIPAGYCLQKGKVLPNSVFSSDKSIQSNQHKYRITQINAYINGTGVPVMLQFIYQNQQKTRVQGKQMIETIPNNLQIKNYKLKDKDYLSQISGTFKNGVLTSIKLKSKIGKQIILEDDNSKGDGQPFVFSSKNNEIPSCFYGATLTNQNGEVRICYLGFEFMSDW